MQVFKNTVFPSFTFSTIPESLHICPVLNELGSSIFLVERVVLEREKIIDDSFGTYPPLGLLYIASYLKQQFKNYIEVEVVDCSIGNWSNKRFKGD